MVLMINFCLCYDSWRINNLRSDLSKTEKLLVDVANRVYINNTVFRYVESPWYR